VLETVTKPEHVGSQTALLF